METNNNNKSTAAILHLSALSQYFIPLGNFIFPLIIWNSSKDKSQFIDANGKNALNFQLSLFLYSLILALISAPLLIITFMKKVSINFSSSNSDFFIDKSNLHNFSDIIIFGLIVLFIYALIKIFEFFYIIYAAVKTSNGSVFKYPLTIKFIK